MRVKLIFTFLVLVAYVSLGQAQTKEEALEWLKTNISLAFVPLVPKDPSFVPQGWTEKRWRENNNEGGSNIYFIDQDKIKFIGEWVNMAHDVVRFDEILYEDDLDKLEKNFALNNRFDYKGFLYVIKLSENRKIDFYTTPEKEADVKRVLKAIMHIAKLSGAKENKQIF